MNRSCGNASSRPELSGDLQCTEGFGDCVWSLQEIQSFRRAGAAGPRGDAGGQRMGSSEPCR